MILIAGGTGRLGTELIQLLTARGARVRVLTRDPDRARARMAVGVEVALGDVDDPQSLQAALKDVEAVVSAVTGFGPGGPGPEAVDFKGNLNLIRAAEAAGARQFVLLSMHGAAPDHPMELMRMKHRAEEALRASRLDWTILRPTVFMELWAGILGEPIVKAGKAKVFGGGDHLINFISVGDVAGFVDLALRDSSLRSTILDVGGPDNLSFNQLVQQIELVAGRKAAVTHVPLPVMRVSRMLMRPFKPDIAGMIEAGICFDTMDMSFDDSELRIRFPQFELTRMREVLGRLFRPSTTASAQKLVSVSAPGPDEPPGVSGIPSSRS